MPLPSVPRRHRRASLLTTFIVAIGLAVPAVTVGAPAVPGPTVDFQVLDISDWHGQLDPVGGIGGAAVLSSYFKAERACGVKSVGKLVNPPL